MFQSLSQGAIIPVLYRNELRVADGKVISVNTHMPIYNPSQPMAMFNGPVTDLTVQVDNDTIPFVGLPASGVTANFNDKGLFLATDKTAVVKEIEMMRAASKQALEQIPAHEKVVAGCEDLLLKLQPEKQKEAQQAQEIENLKTQLSDMNGKFDKLVELLSAKTADIKN